ncbi:hypothetical protein [Streptomyces sp. NPDC049915]|uniref:hypothetical protein n=1 Tax=Streptomyces sp. NPDC049915 TaxID=3155510 RepID=UPI00341268B0
MSTQPETGRRVGRVLRRTSAVRADAPAPLLDGLAGLAHIAVVALIPAPLLPQDWAGDDGIAGPA